MSRAATTSRPWRATLPRVACGPGFRASRRSARGRGAGAAARDPARMLERRPGVLLAAPHEVGGAGGIEAQQVAREHLLRLHHADARGIALARPRRRERQDLGPQIAPVPELEQTRAHLE